MPLTIDITQYELYQEGKAEGKAEGIAEGLAKGEAKGLAKGKAKARVELVEQFLQLKTVSLDAIAKASGFTMKEIIAIRDQIEKKSRICH